MARSARKKAGKKAGKKGKFKYHKRSPESVKQRANQKSGNFDVYIKEEFKIFKPREGKNIIRVLPPTYENHEDQYAMHIYLNYNIGVDKQAYLSLSAMKDEDDPIEEARMEAEQEGDVDLAKALKAKKRALMWVIDRNDEDEGPQVWPAPWTVERDMSNLTFDEDDGSIMYIDEPDEGNDFRFYKQGTGRNTEYNPSKMKFLKPSPLSKDADQQQEWLDFIVENPLDEILVYYPYEHIKAIFEGGSYGDDDEDDDDKPKRRGKPKKGKKTRSKIDDDDEDDDEIPFDPDDEDEDDDDDEGEDDDDEGEDDDDEDEDDEDDDDEDDDDDDDDDDEDDDDEPKKSVKDKIRERKKPKRSKRRK